MNHLRPAHGLLLPQVGCGAVPEHFVTVCAVRLDGHSVITLQRSTRLWAVTALGIALVPAVVRASPAMIRLGYPTCQACHLSPQGRGLLTDYGKGIDETHSARGGVYNPGEDRRRLFHDLRLLTQLSSEASAQPERATSAGVRLWYRNVTLLTSRTSVGATVSVDAPIREDEITSVQPLPSQPRIFLNRALWEYAPRKDLHIAVGRDVLPSGVEIADQAAYMRARNRQGLTDVPTQAKLFWWNERFQIVPYAFGPSGLEARAFRTRGAGVLAEMFGLRDRLAAGISARVSRNATFDERLLGVYARLGLGRWAVLAEHDVTRRTGREEPTRAFDQFTGYAQLFFYPTDWIVASVSLDHLRVDEPHRDRRLYVRPELSIRVNPHLTVAVSVRDQSITPAQRATAAVLQVFLKTVS